MGFPPQIQSELLALLHHGGKFLVFCVVHRVGVLVVWKRSVLDLFDVLTDPSDRDFSEPRKSLGEFRLEISKHAEQIMTQQNLAIGADAGADANGGDSQLFGN